MKKNLKKLLKDKKDKLVGLKILTGVNFLVAFVMFSLRYIEVINMTNNSDVTNMGSSILLMDTVSYTSIFAILIAIYTCIALFRKNRNALLVAIILTIIISATNVPAIIYDYVNNPISSLSDIILIVVAFVAWVVSSIIVYEKSKEIIEK